MTSQKPAPYTGSLMQPLKEGDGLDMVPKAWIGLQVVVQLNMPMPMPQSDLALPGQQGQQAMGLGFPEMSGVLLADLPNGIVLRTKSNPLGISIIKGQVFTISPLVGQESTGILVS